MDEIDKLSKKMRNLMDAEEVDTLISSQKNIREEIHGQLAIEIARQPRNFPPSGNEWHVDPKNHVRTATGGDVRNLLHWKNQMKMDVTAQNDKENATSITMNSDGGGISVEKVENISNDRDGDVHEGPKVTPINDLSPLTSADPSELNEEQYRAYDIIVHHLTNTLSGNKPPPLRMIIYGEGGTGKSEVIQTITDAFKDAGVYVLNKSWFRVMMSTLLTGAEYMLMKSAYTGVAASLIAGRTTHTVASISLRYGGKLSPQVKRRLQAFWKDKTYLIINKYSMLSKLFLARLSRNISIGKQGSSSERTGLSFSGVNVILCGDLHQFPPVVRNYGEHLFCPTNLSKDNIDCQIG